MTSQKVISIEFSIITIFKSVRSLIDTDVSYVTIHTKIRVVLKDIQIAHISTGDMSVENVTRSISGIKIS